MKSIMNRKVLSVLLFFMATTFVLAQKQDNLWMVFERVPFEVKFSEAENGYFYFPEFGKEIKDLVGKEVEITGHYLPYDFGEDFFIISKYPYASCFFCGGAGPESIAAIYPGKKLRKLKMDEIITIKGKLTLNSDDVDNFNFILKDAVLLD